MSLQSVIAERIGDVDERVSAAGDAYAVERTGIRHAAAALPAIVRRLGLGEFRRPLGQRTGKPQLVLEFDDNRGRRVVLKVMGAHQPAEGFVQQWWSRAGVRVVEVLEHGDEPVSWLLTPYIESQPLEPDDIKNNWRGVTTQLAQIVAAAHNLEPRSVPGALPLSEALEPHLGIVVAALARHGYRVAAWWREGALAAYMTEPQTTLHGDLGASNILLDGFGSLWLIDVCGYLGNAAFDAARWSARLQSVETAMASFELWNSREPVCDSNDARRLLGAELLMTAGVRELLKEERRTDWGGKDPVTVSLLEEGLLLLQG